MDPRSAPTPGRRRPPLMFASRFEVAAFWVCVAGLVLVLALAALRFLESRSTAALEARVTEQEQEIRQLRQELDAARAHLDSLQRR